jgi:hypothetical protein
MEKKLYAEMFQPRGYEDWAFKIYHYDETGNKEIIVHKSPPKYRDKTDAENAAMDYADMNDLDVELY